MRKTRKFGSIAHLRLLTALSLLMACQDSQPSEQKIMRQSTIQSEEPAATAFPANHLAGETSPYLLQHAHNPVDWHPWGEEALKLAREQNKLIFLSIGYAACHWCHVMERESFMDPEIAKILNEHFISIKVDREERPDVDEIYMTAVQLMTGSGGWPLNVFLTPELKPFFGGTYFPPEDNYGRPAFRTVLLRVAELWRDAPEDLLGGAERVVEAIKAHTAGEFAGSSNARFDESILTEAAAALAKTFDAEWGGFSPEPKFPPSSAIALLLRQYHHTGDSELLKMATITLDRMAQGGLYDQLGGGFHRYSTDARWLVPHFEKMLYDNALLARVYLEAWQATHKELYRRVARETLDYVLRDMTDPGGGFHSSEDADSEGEEGKFYVWRLAELSDVLGPEDGGFFGLHYGVTVPGDFEGSNILHVPRPAVKSAADQADEESLEARLAPLRDKLLARRNERVRPGKDDKVLTAWNGMMISALARGYQVLGDERYLQAAEKAADFILTELVRDGALLRTWRNTGGAPGEDKAKLPAYLDDYAQMIFALTDLYEATFELERLEEADRLAARMIEEFWDEEHGGFFNTSAAHKNLLTRTKSTFDGPELSGNSVAVFALLRLAILLDQADYRQKAELTLNKLSDELHRRPSAMMNMLCAADFFLHAPREIAIAGKLDDAGTRLLLEHIHHRYLPNKVLALFNPGEAQARNMIERRIPLLKGKVLLDGKTTVYVCRNFACQQPVNELSALAKILDK